MICAVVVAVVAVVELRSRQHSERHSDVADQRIHFHAFDVQVNNVVELAAVGIDDTKD